jgi:hypothetical protein
MEFLRFGSSIPGSYWGCCACCIIQNFKFDPDEKASIQLVNGDAGCALGDKFAGPTYRDIFTQRIRYGTFDSRDMPNHAFMAILTEEQLKGTYGKAWLAILKDHGFEFIRSVSNSVYTGNNVASNHTKSRGTNKNYIFMMVRNIGTSGDGNAFTPPKEWLALPKVMDEAWEYLSDWVRLNLSSNQFNAHKYVWDKVGPAKFYKESELEAMGVPVTYAGLRSPNPQQLKQHRKTNNSSGAFIAKAAG